MPVVKAGRGEDARQGTEVDAQVGVDQHGLKRDEDEIGIGGGGREAEHVDRHEAHRARHDDVDQVQARAGQPVEVAARVVDGVKAPEQGHLVKEPVDGVLSEIGDQEDLAELQDPGLAGEPILQSRAHRPAEEDRRGHQGQEHRGLDTQMAHREVREVRGPAGPEDLLLGPLGEELLDRHEEHGEDEHVQQEPVEAEVVGWPDGRRDLDGRAAHEGGQHRQPHAGEPEGLAALEQEARRAQDEGQHEGRLDERAHQGHVIHVPQLRSGEERGEPEAEDGGEAHHAEHGRGDARRPSQGSASTSAQGRVSSLRFDRTLSVFRIRQIGPWP